MVYLLSLITCADALWSFAIEEYANHVSRQYMKRNRNAYNIVFDIAVNLYNKDLRNIPDYGIFSIIKTVFSECLYLAACDKLNEMVLKIVQSFYEYLLKICQINYHLKERIEIA